jgi:1-phosphatidylinositol-3-phosphate 5-kinase
MSDNTLPINIVGGTFTLNGVTSKAQYDSLCHILRLALFTIMSLLLEQQLLLDSHNAVRYPPPPTIPVQSPPAVRDTSPSPPPLSPQSPSPIPSSPTLEMPSRRKVVTSGIWSYLAKKKEGLFARLDSPTSDSTSPRGGSLDIRPPSSVVPTSPPLLSEGGDLRRRTLSFLGVVMPRPMIPRPPPSPPIFNPSEEQVFTTTLQRLKLSIVVLSTTPGSAFDPPSLITRLAQMEANDPRRRTTGDDVTALRSLSGWSGANRIARAKELSGVVAGFVRFQTFVALYSEHVPIPVEPWEPLEPSGSDADSETSSLSHTPAPSEAGTATSSVLTNPASGLSATSEPSGPSSPPRSTTLGLTGQDNSHPRSRSPSQHRPAPDKDTLLTQCTARRRLIAYSYYSRKANEDVRLGSAVEEWCRDALKPCSKPNCKFLRGEHELRWIHAGIRITLQKHFPDEELEEARERNAKKTSEDQSLTKYEPEYDPGREMQVWARCKVCGKETERSQAGDGTQYVGRFSSRYAY